MKWLTALALLVQLSRAADKNAWKSRSIYFAMTDRIARRAQDSGGSACGDLGNYCGGTFAGLQGKLDYIKGMGIEYCRIGNLPDVDTADDRVRSVYNTWIKWLVNEYEFDGVRIDTVRHVEKAFWPGFSSAAGVYTIGEVSHGDPNYVAGYAALMSGLVNYPVYYPLSRFYQQKGSSQDLVDMHNAVGSAFPDPAALGTFLDNHDTARFLSQKNDVSLLKNALTYVFLARGIPIVYYGTEQSYAGGGEPANREDLWRSSFRSSSDVYKFLAKMAGIRKAAGGLSRDDHAHLMVEPTGYAWSRANGRVIALTSNIGQGKSRQYCIWNQKAGETWHGAFDGNKYVVDGNGHLCATVTNGEPMVFVASVGTAGYGSCLKGHESQLLMAAEKCRG
ncbi:hypothetical protein UVI_02015230 [Ustilaginoidea virens]|uniref:Glycosyl hydrolase family 13 catalytic domain-containing protein n=1 Tax=Ustilaginoidea virens TaxID=1159556 RepID=A0A1B5KS06_USTVR|nr:hypothetical protein UVI_02015230 [Ustilaginoidea virens]